MSDTYDFILNLRAIRDYTNDPVSKEHLEQIVEAARWTGSSKNTQNWTFLVFTDRAKLHRLAAGGNFTDPIRNATAAIVLVQEPQGYEFDIGRAAQNIMLAAKAIGVASCPITLHIPDAISDLLDLSDGQSARYAVALGYPADDAAPRKFGGRKDTERLVRWM